MVNLPELITQPPRHIIKHTSLLSLRIDDSLSINRLILLLPGGGDWCIGRWTRWVLRSEEGGSSLSDTILVNSLRCLHRASHKSTPCVINNDKWNLYSFALQESDQCLIQILCTSTYKFRCVTIILDTREVFCSILYGYGELLLHGELFHPVSTILAQIKSIATIDHLAIGHDFPFNPLKWHCGRVHGLHYLYWRRCLSFGNLEHPHDLPWQCLAGSPPKCSSS